MMDGECKMMIRLLSLSLRVGQVALEELGHAEGADLVLSEDGLHLGVRLEVLLVLGVLELVRPEVVKRIWAYLKANKLQDPENKQYFKPDAKMKPIFGEDKVRAFGMAKFLKSHLTNP